ncbi:hypothetical protein [Chryseobacterium sp. c4a]|uniref:hypothetical protein n=1 Tax=Chryseobacterium sp. c4a TaxID=1573582 RepID=UPI001358B23A|nr:hypothetical protein [Chryseobacterium sp. c4a]
MKKRKHQLIKNIAISFANLTSIDPTLTYRTADIIFLEDEIFIIPFIRPILHLNSNPEIILPGTQKLKILSRLQSDNLIEMNVSDNAGSLTIILDLKNKNIEIPSVNKHL